jgi:hypothetical protein
MLNNDQGFDQFSTKAYVKLSGSVIKVFPGPADTQALIDAFALAKTYGKNAVVKLMPGTFTIGMIEVREFYGTFAGSGKGNTIITNIPDLSPDANIALNKLPALIKFIGGDVKVSNLSVMLSEGLPWIGQIYEMDMLLFSDYSADFMPAKKHISVNLDNIEVTGVPLTSYLYDSFSGVKFSPDMLTPTVSGLIPRSNIDATVTNSRFSKLCPGILVRGCKNGNFKFGEGGGNIFTENTGGLFVQANVGITVKIMKNEFTTLDNSLAAIDLNAAEDWTFEYSPTMVGTYEIRDNIFNIHMGCTAAGLWDNWRYDHPENPDFMKMIWDHNTFNALGDGASMSYMFGLKNSIFSNNKILGDAQGGYFGVFGSWYGEGDPNYSLMWSENCKFLNNLFLQKGFVIDLKPTTKNCLIMGDLSNVTINNAGVNNKVIRIKK